MRIDDIPLLKVAGRPCTGSVFELLRPSREQYKIHLGHWEIELAAGSLAVVARGGRATSYATALQTGLDRTLQALDIIGLKRANALTLRAPEDEHIVYWAAAGKGFTVRCVSHHSFGLRASARATGGIPVAEPAPRWHQSLRYFRLSQTSDDLFDAFRNLFLALESLLSDIAPPHVKPSGKPNEGELVWFRRALKVALGAIPLARIMNRRRSNPVEYLVTQLYINTRGPLSHAKSNRRSYLPQSARDRLTVARGLDLGVRLYQALADHYLQSRPFAGFTSPAAFTRIVQATSDVRAFVSDDESVFDPTEERPNPGGGTLREMTLSEPLDIPQQFYATQRWSVAANTLDLPFIRRIVTIDREGTAMTTVVLPGRLHIDGADHLEALLGTRGIPAQHMRARYPR